METERNQNQPEQTNSEKRILTGMFADCESAEKAYTSLHERNYTTNDINLIMPY